ncbi:uncharacterized protein LOC144911302 isoform X2 [Branchiostoma floridae x Branchiostoma belcheri]
MNRAPLHCVCFLCLLTFGLFHQAEAAAHHGFDPVSVTAKDPYLESLKNNEVLQKLFNKYGKDGKMTFEGFQELLDRLGLGEVRIVHHEAMIIDHKEGRNSSTDTVSVVDTFGDTDHVHYPHNDNLDGGHSDHDGHNHREESGTGHQNQDHSDHSHDQDSHESAMSGEAHSDHDHDHPREEPTQTIKQVPQSPTTTPVPVPAAMQEAPSPRPGRHSSSRRQRRKGKRRQRQRGRKSKVVPTTSSTSVDLLEITTETLRRDRRRVGRQTGREEDEHHDGHDHDDHEEEQEHGLEDHDHEHGDHDHEQKDDHEHEDHDHGDHDHEHEDHDHGDHDHEHEDHDHGDLDHEHGDHEHDDHDLDHGDHEHDDHDHEHRDHEHEDHDHEHGEQDHGDHEHDDHDHEHGDPEHEDHEHDDHDHDDGDHEHGDNDHDNHNHKSHDHGKDDHDDHLHDHNNEDHDHHDHEPGAHCLSAAEILVEYNIPPGMKVMTMPDFMNICPLLITQIDEQACMVHEEDSHDHSEHDHEEHKGTEMPAAVWGYGILAVTVISLLAVLGIVLLPFMEQRVYQFLLCFLVALAVGTLTGDAVLHLLPHALGLHAHADEGGHEGHEGHDEGHGDKGGHLDPVLKGLTVLFGIYFLFIMEKLMGVMTKRRAKRKAKKLRKQKELAHPAESYELKVATDSPIEDDHCHHHHHHHHHDNEKLKDAGIATMAWMVIMGDGLHNFSDGLAIGAAFASGIPGGVSTSIAVFCHELPHELGDFALLIRAGMSVKQAILYNLMSACICYIGLLIGLGIGKLSGNVIQYVFAVTAGMFLYVGLVDMLPDMVHPNQPQVIAEHDHGEHGHGHSHRQNDFSLDNNHGKRKKKQEPVNPVLVQTFGLLVGIGIMLLIAVYEDKIKI